MSMKGFMASFVIDIASNVEYQSIIEQHSLYGSVVIISGFKRKTGESECIKTSKEKRRW